jgi:hypothetical protein
VEREEGEGEILTYDEFAIMATVSSSLTDCCGLFSLFDHCLTLEMEREMFDMDDIRAHFLSEWIGEIMIRTPKGIVSRLTEGRKVRCECHSGFLIIRRREPLFIDLCDSMISLYRSSEETFLIRSATFTLEFDTVVPEERRKLGLSLSLFLSVSLSLCFSLPLLSLD